MAPTIRVSTNYGDETVGTDPPLPPLTIAVTFKTIQTCDRNIAIVTGRLHLPIGWNAQERWHRRKLVPLRPESWQHYMQGLNSLRFF